MKRQPSLKRRARFSDSSDAADQPEAALIDRRDRTRRKQIEHRGGRAAVDAHWTSEWDGTALEFLEPQPRR